MKFVLDSNIAIKWVLPESDSLRALSLRDDFLKQIHEFIAPDVFPVEVAHALSKAERRGLVPHLESIVRLVDVLAVAPILHPHLPLLSRAMEISTHARIGVYDCLYVALAEKEGCELITADARLAAALPNYPIIDLAEWP
ncbi:type II toxin-antitoxin system VapC family toxin [Anatilimnocola floriformis]|uniref:type II toxin-antitoxin system VapC family toxin n=1 Tax=Anatilimnocola floriformis TaxID=2948575 RepID=UPI0020C24DBC|nr:type II toxin-antitoxin system VapC family toxin [Anatilimnocola floriformis]